MKKYSFFLIVASALISINASAQSFQTGYFLDNYVYGYRLNPALHDEGTRTMFGLGIGDISAASSSNVGMSSFLFPKNDELVLGLNENVTSEEFLNGLKDLNQATSSIDWSIVNFGYKTKHGFFTFDVRMLSHTNTSVSKDLFAMLKDNFSKDKTYNIGQLSVNSANFLELGGTYSMRVGDFRFGIGANLLLGITSANINASNVTAKINETGEIIDVTVGGTATSSIASPLFDIDTDTFELGDGTPGLAGIGFGIDLGVLWNTPVNGLSASFAVTDLGGISWHENFAGKMVANTYSGKTDEVIADIFNLKEVDQNKFESLGATFDLGVKYKMPFYQRLTVGAHGSLTCGTYAYRDIRLGLTVTPIDQISIAATVGSTTYGTALGCAANFRLGPIAIFGGVDGIVKRITPQGLPVDAPNTVAKLGITVALKDK